MLEAEIAVPVAHPPVGRALFEERPVVAQEARLPGRELAHLVAPEELPELARRLHEVFLHVEADHVRVGVLAVRERRRGVEGREERRHGVELGGRERPLGEHHVGAVGVREAPHVHRPIDEGLVALRHRDDTEVDSRCKTCVEAHLCLACRVALLEGTEVEEAQVDGLF